MTKVVITKTDFQFYVWDGDLRENVKCDNVHPYAMLSTATTIEEGVTLLDIFNVVDKYQDIKDFIEEYSYVGDIDAFHTEARLPKAKLEKEFVDLSSLRITSVVERWNRTSSVDIRFDFSGVVDSDPETGYSLSLSPLNTYAHCPVILDQQFITYFNEQDEYVKERRDTYYTLLDILDCIYNDISFYGNAEDREAFSESLQQQVDDIESGRVKTIPMEEVIERLKEKYGEEDDRD